MTYTYTEARYARDCIAVTVPSSDGFKHNTHYCAEAVHARFSGREHAYIMSQSQFKRFQALVESGSRVFVFMGRVTIDGVELADRKRSKPHAR